MRKCGHLLLGAGVLMAVACGKAATPSEVELSNTTNPTLPDGAPNPNFDPATVPPILPDGAPNPIFDASLPDGAVLPGFDSGRTDAGRDASTPPADAGRDSSTPPLDAGNPGTPGVVSINGIAAWDALPAVEQNKLKTGFRTVFIHQSVGADLEYGAEVNGFKFEFYQVAAPTALPITSNGLNGGLTLGRNGQGPQKVDDLQRIALANKAILRVAILKFGYADIVASTLAAAQTAYLNGVNAIKAQGVRVLHITPPFVYNVPSENAPKMQMRTWMMSTFPNDVIFDLEDVESTEPVGGARCQRGGSWEICDSIRSKPGCPSKEQGTDAPSGQGHICQTTVPRISKAFLYAIYQAGK
jgi:hypothetical protein